MRYSSDGTCAALAVAASVLAFLTFSASTARAEQAIASKLAAAADQVAADPTQAIESLRQLSAEPAAEPLGDAVLFLVARALTPADSTAAREQWHRLLARYPRSPFAARALAELIALDEAAPDTAKWLAELERYVAGDWPRADVAALALAMGSRMAASDPKNASRALTHARKLGKGDSTSRAAAAILRRIREAQPALVPKDAESMYQEARLCAAEGDPTEQARWLDRLISDHPSSGRGRDALLLRARVLGVTSGRSAAAQWLETRAEKEPDKALRARLLLAAGNHRWNADEDTRALGDFARVIELAPSGAGAQEARYAVARIHEAARRYSEAAEDYRAAARGPDQSLAAESDWRTGWTAYAAGDFAVAADAFAAMLSKYPGKEPRGARETALYWHARSTERASGEVAAVPFYRRLLEEFPDGYYAFVAETRGRGAAAAPKVKTLPETAAVSDEARIALLRAEAFEQSGFRDASAVEIHRLLARLSPTQKKSTLPALHGAGAYSAALKTALALYYRGIVSESELYPYYYPRAYAETVEREGARTRIEPSLIYALMKQESLFDRHAVSPASAYGLMQLLLSTAKRVAGEAEASRIGIESLFRPEVNVRLGTAYLAELARRFDGRLVFVLAGYNAGERAAAGWQQRFGNLEIDELVERISYRETRDYVKKVLANYRNYRRLYGGA